MADPLFDRFGHEFPAGTLLFNEGEYGEEMFIVHSGSVKITKQVRDTEKLLAIIPAGEFFGEMAILTAKPRSATATVHEDAKILVISAETFEGMIKGNTEIALRMIKKLADRLAEADKQIENLLLRDTNSRVVHGLAYLAESRGTDTGDGIQLRLGVPEVADRTGLKGSEVEEVIERLKQRELLSDLDGGGYFIPDVQKMWELVDFLSLQAKFGEFS